MTVSEYNTCVDNFSDGVYRFVLKNIKDSDMAKDIVQETFLKLWEKHENVNYDKAKSYIFTSAYHTMIDLTRKNKKVVLYDNQDANDSFEFQTGYKKPNEFFDIKRVINIGLDKLPADQKAVILLRDYEGYSYGEIGEITGLTEAQVKVYIYRGRMFLKNYLVSMDLIV